MNLQKNEGGDTVPKELERKLAREATKKGLTGERKDAYVYGTMRKMGWKPEREKEEMIRRDL